MGKSECKHDKVGKCPTCGKNVTQTEVLKHSTREFNQWYKELMTAKREKRK
jgi:endogenous inhibitor of DNA gyrase (YacG/DUF329 family)